jgi:hypothetical protein
VFLFVRIPVWNFLTGKVSAPDAIAGEWVGTVDITGQYLPDVFGKTTGPHRKGALKFTLTLYDGFMDSYTGPGELYIYGEASPRAIKIGDLRCEPDGSLKVKINTTPDLGWAYGSHGRLEGNTMVWDANASGLTFTARLSHGTDAEYQRLLQDKQ